MKNNRSFKNIVLLLFVVLLHSQKNFSQEVKFDDYTSIYKKRSSESKNKILYIGGGDYHDDLRKASILRK